MSPKAKVIKVQLQLADMDRHHYQDYSLTLAQHPSENDARVMVRLLAFALQAAPGLTFTKGLSAGEEQAELWLPKLEGGTALWVEFGQPDEKWLRKASHRADQVVLYCYGGRAVGPWWQQNQAALTRYRNLEVWQLPEEQVQAAGLWVQRNLSLQCNINEGQIWLSSEQGSLTIEPERLQ